jgi:glycosyltransferase involved in cell wall biosynthesis
LYSNARALVFPSLYEGFGLPVLEGLAAGCPVLCSDLPVFSEIGAKAIWTLDSSSASTLTESLIEAMDFTPAPLEIRRTLKRFSSQAAGVKLLRLYETIALKKEWRGCRPHWPLRQLAND